jgi:hypothetical protein
MGLKEAWNSLWKKDQGANKTRKPASSHPIVDFTESIVANKALTKGLYYNTAPGYKLAGALCYNIIAVPIAFCGYPTPITSTGNQDDLEELMKLYNQDFVKILRQCHREGTIWIYPRYDSKKNKVVLEFIDDETVTEIYKHPETGELEAIRVTKETVVLNPTGQEVNVKSDVLYTKTKITTKYESYQYSGLKNSVKRNVLGILPIVFANMADGNDTRGYSDYSRSLPDLNSYHRTSLKMLVDLNDFRTKQVQNTGEQSAESWACDQGYETLEEFLDDADVQDSQFILNSGKADTKFITAQGLVDSALAVLKNIYMKIVQSCGVPELFWGLKQPGNANTAEEAMTTLINYVTEKRNQNTGKFQVLIESILFLKNLSVGLQKTEKVTITWNQLDAVSDTSRAEIWKNFCEGLSKSFQSGVLSIPQAYQLWKENYPQSIGDMDLDKFTRELTKTMVLLRARSANPDTEMGKDPLKVDNL